MTVIKVISKLFQKRKNILKYNLTKQLNNRIRYFSNYNKNKIPSHVNNNPLKIGLIGGIGGLFGGICGVGGGVIMIPLLRQTTTLTAHQVAATSLIAVATGATLAAISFSNSNKNIMRIPIGLSMAGCAMLTSSIGALVSSRISAKALTIITASILYASTVPIYYKAKSNTTQLTKSEIEQREKSDLLFYKNALEWTKLNYEYCLIGCLAGFASGLIGIGGGIVITTLLSGFTDLTQHETVATSIFTMLPTSMVALSVHMYKGNINARIGIPLALTCGLGMWVASKVALDISDENLRKIFIAFLFVSSSLMVRDVYKLTQLSKVAKTIK